MSSGKSVLIIGPGFIGWNVLDRLISENYKVTGLVRRVAHGQQIQLSGATFVVSDLDDRTTIKNQTIQHDIIFHTATADHLPSVEAVLDGIRERAGQGKSTIFIHTSGTGVLNDDSNGAFESDKIYHDDNRAEVDSVADDAPHRPIDLTIVRAQREIGDKAKIAIMIPPLIYGFNPVHRRLSIQIPTLTRFALKHGYAGHVGPGLSVESQIHVLDLARAYIVLLHHMEASAPDEFLDNPYYFCENGCDTSWKAIATMIGQGLAKAGKVKSSEPKTIPESDYDDLFGREYTGATIGLNSRSRAVRLRQLGWEPKERSVQDSYEMFELPQILSEVEST
ncbi:hypothetical protein B0A52_01050 [Exophiala mesophila]|uniref:NAD(P)-binding domain-containing protein n=1 Tax=Exophiala mesophila TaxID=212818 RepID=A0A438NGC0_EXOME|nr:hypothetical protein B0A52_01050 [Exophiala mesophila]